MTDNSTILGAIGIGLLAQAHLVLQGVNRVRADREWGVLLVVNPYRPARIRMGDPNTPDKLRAAQEFALQIVARTEMESRVLIVSSGALQRC
jgi:hypothetical protein